MDSSRASRPLAFGSARAAHSLREQTPGQPWTKAVASYPPRRAEPSACQVLFVCTGNVCRSAFADAYLRARLPADAFVEVSSAGIAAQVGWPLDALMAEQAKARGVPAEGHAARQVTGQDLLAADLILVFGPEHREWIRVETPEVARRVFALEQVSSALGMLASSEPIGWHQLAEQVRSLRPSPQDTDWIADPYGGGRQAAFRAAEAISSAIDVIVGRVH